MRSAHPPGSTLVEALGRGLPGDRLVTDPGVLAALSHDDAEWAPVAQAVAGQAPAQRLDEGAARRVR